MRLSIPRPLIVPASKIVRLCYSETFAFQPAAGGVATQVMRANSLFDPNQTGTGGQPPGVDQWAAFYQHYTVLSSTIKLTVIPHPVEPDSFAYVGQGMVLLQSRRTATNPSYANQIPATDHAKTSHRFINGLNQTTVSLRQSFSVRKDMGHAPNSRNEALITSNPDESWHYVIQYSNPMDPVVNPARINIVARMCYIVRFNDRTATIYDS